VRFHLRYISLKPALPLQQLSCTSSKTPSLSMQYAKGASSRISHQDTPFLSFSMDTTDEVRKEVESAKIRTTQSHLEKHSLNNLNFHQKMGFFITKQKISHSPQNDFPVLPYHRGLQNPLWKLV
jgi:hypothetical protein